MLAATAAAGFRNYEAGFNDAAEVESVATRLARHGLACRSFYHNSLLHDPAKSSESIAKAVAIAKAGRPHGITQAVINPEPLDWKNKQLPKSDAQLRHQAEALNLLGAELRELGTTLAYHIHDHELAAGAKELHHMLVATDPANVKLCFEPHWIFTGAGDSALAALDVLHLYLDRVVEIHLRQSRGGIVSEFFTVEGDLDYATIFKTVRDRGLKPVFMIEQAIEAETPETMTAAEACAKSLANVRAALG